MYRAVRGGKRLRTGYAGYRGSRLVSPSPIRRVGSVRRGVYTVARRQVRRRIGFGVGPGAYARVAARRLLVRRALTGGAVAVGALAGYGMYRGFRRLRRRRTARRLHASQRRHVGVRVGTSRTKEVLTQNVHENPHTSYTLHQHEVTVIGALDKANNHKRQRNDINLRGFRMNLRVRHEASAPGVLIMMLVSLKHGANLSAVDNDFFKSRNGDEISFPSGGGAFPGSDYVDLGINKEVMNVLWYKKLELAPRGVSSPGAQDYTMLSGKNYVQINQYVKMNRQINFNLDTDQSPEAPHSVYFIHWYANPFESANIPVSARYVLTRKISAIWRELTH